MARKAYAKRILLVAGIVVLAAAAASSGLMVARFTSAKGYPVSALHEGVNPSNLQITPMFVVKNGSRIIALRAFAPDSSVPVAWCPGQGFFEDPSTGAKWSEDGTYLSGPAPRGLDRFSSKVTRGVLVVAPNSLVFGAPAGVTRPPALPPCDWASAQFAPGVAAPPSPIAEQATG